MVRAGGRARARARARARFRRLVLVGARRAAEAAGRERGGLEGAWAARYLLLAAGSRVVARLGGRTHPG